MKIGKFGETNGLSLDTIRHYMDLGLLVPEKKGGHYFFDERCQQDLELVLELKGMGFSLQEIKVIFHYKNFATLADYEQDAYYQSLFSNQYKKVVEEISRLTEIKEKLKRKLDDLAVKSPAASSVIGIDLKVLDLLKCIDCGEQLSLHDGTISRNQIIEGKLACDCGREYLVESGIMVVGTPFESKLGVQLKDGIFDYIHETDPAYLEYVQKGLHWSKRKLFEVDLQDKILLELGSGAGFFLRNVYQKLSADCLYIAVDHSLDRHRLLKNLLERTGLKRNILFICADFRDIPIKDKLVDVLIDLSGTSNYSFEHEEFLLREVDAFVKSDGYLLGSYIAFKNFSHKSKVESRFRSNFTAGDIRKNLIELQYNPLEERTSEYVDKGGKYENFFIEGEEIYSYAFFGKR